MARKQFATSIDTEIADNFRKACDEYGVKMNVVLETFMKQFARKEFETPKYPAHSPTSFRLRK